VLGTIRRRHLVAHPVVTVRCFGWRIFARALVAGREQTFLSVLGASGLFVAEAEEAPDLVGRAAALERRARFLYDQLSLRFAEPAARFFASLADQEAGHAELLELAKVAAGPGGFGQDDLVRWDRVLGPLEVGFTAFEARADAAATLDESLRLTIELESSELNHVYLGVMAAANSDFVRHVALFRDAGREHIRYIAARIPELSPALAPACRELDAAYRAYGSGAGGAAGVAAPR
jgi:hypothetical protein